MSETQLKLFIVQYIDLFLIFVSLTTFCFTCFLTLILFIYSNVALWTYCMKTQLLNMTTNELQTQDKENVNVLCEVAMQKLALVRQIRATVAKAILR